MGVGRRVQHAAAVGREAPPLLTTPWARPAARAASRNSCLRAAPECVGTGVVGGFMLVARSRLPRVSSTAWGCPLLVPPGCPEHRLASTAYAQAFLRRLLYRALPSGRLGCLSGLLARRLALRRSPTIQSRRRRIEARECPPVYSTTTTKRPARERAGGGEGSPHNCCPRSRRARPEQRVQRTAPAGGTPTPPSTTPAPGRGGFGKTERGSTRSRRWPIYRRQAVSAQEHNRAATRRPRVGVLSAAGTSPPNKKILDASAASIRQIRLPRTSNLTALDGHALEPRHKDPHPRPGRPGSISSNLGLRWRVEEF